MPRRLPTFFPLTLAATVGLFALTSALTAQPPTPAPPALPAAGTDDDGSRIKSTGEANYKAYKQFAEALLRLAQKWEKGSPEEQERAKAIRAALAIADQKGVDRLFKDVSSGLKGTQNPTTPEFKKLLQDDKKLIAALNEILVALETEGETARLKKDIDNLKRQIEKTKAILREQENLRARTEGKGDPDKIAKDQGNLAKRTQDLADQLAGKSPSKGGGKDPKDDKSEQKTKAKPGDKAAEPKDDTSGSKSSDKAGGEPKDSASQKGGPKDGMTPDGGSSKESPKDGGMSDPMAGGAKPMGDPKGGEPKDPMGGMNPSEPKPPMGSDPMAAKPSPGDNKSQGMGKGESKPSKGQQGGDSKPMNSPGSPSPSDSQQGSSKGSPSPSSPSPPSPSSPQNPNAPAQKNLDEAVPDQKGAQKDLNKPDRREASKKEDQAIQKIKQALDELEKRLKQLREKEMAKKLQDLEQRVKLMLEMQKTILAGTEGIDSKIRSNRGSIVDQDRLNSQALSEKEQTIVDEADRALDLLKGEGSAVVFAGVLGEVRKDMEAVRDQLQSTQVGEETQLVERQIIAQLERMLKALEKAQQDLKPPPPPMPGEPPPPSDPKKDLIKLVEQLKLLRELQVQVNERTALFGKKTPGAQATDKFVVDQLKLLGERQRVLQEMLQKIASGDQ